MKRNKLYFIFLLASLLGYVYLFFQYNDNTKSNVTFCVIKNVTGYACPSCGITRAFIEIIKGNFVTAIGINPLAIIVAFALLLFPIWILIDLISKKDSFYNWYKKIELQLQKKHIAIPLILLVILNWIWNINKGL